MDVAETPRVLVLAWLTGVGVNARAAGSAAPAMPPPPGVPEGASTSQAINPTTMAMTMSAVRTCMARGRRRSRRHERRTGAQGAKAPRSVWHSDVRLHGHAPSLRSAAPRLLSAIGPDTISASSLAPR